jgi:Flp pilus assembly protein TadG
MSRRPGSSGQALVEFALVVPIFLALLMGIVDFGRVVWASNSLASAAREGARFAIVHGGSPMDPCPVGPLAAQYGDPPPVSSSCPDPAPSTKAVKDAALSAAMAGGTSIVVTVCYGLGCSGNTDSTTGDGDNTRGNPVTVTVSSQLPLTVPSLLGFSTFSVSGSSTMLVNH